MTEKHTDSLEIIEKASPKDLMNLFLKCLRMNEIQKDGISALKDLELLEQAANKLNASNTQYQEEFVESFSTVMRDRRDEAVAIVDLKTLLTSCAYLKVDTKIALQCSEKFFEHHADLNKDAADEVADYKDTVLKRKGYACITHPKIPCTPC
ncbi:MAG: hypothetical protein OIF36_05400 [Alphaproteobacteria bacterium]|nr:hypothetical protein [Alphaproteobacteria bacterium]